MKDFQKVTRKQEIQRIPKGFIWWLTVPQRLGGVPQPFKGWQSAVSPQLCRSQWYKPHLSTESVYSRPSHFAGVMLEHKLWITDFWMKLGKKEELHTNLLSSTFSYTRILFWDPSATLTWYFQLKRSHTNTYVCSTHRVWLESVSCELCIRPWRNRHNSQDEMNSQLEIKGLQVI